MEKAHGGDIVSWTGYDYDFRHFRVGLSKKRAEWAHEWCSKVASSDIYPVRMLGSGLGRLGFAASLLTGIRPLLGPFYACASVMPDSAVQQIPMALRLLLQWVGNSCLKERQAVLMPMKEGARILLKADAKAEGELAVIGDWEVLEGEEGP